jgi:hypothetical protein
MAEHDELSGARGMVRGMGIGLIMWALIGVLVLLLAGCGIRIPTTVGEAQFDENGKIQGVRYESTKAQSGFHAEYNPTTKLLVIKTDNADSPRGYEDYVKGQVLIELQRLELYQKMTDALISAGKSAAPVPTP